MIIISEPKIIKTNKKVRLVVKVELNNSVKELWLEVDEKYAKYLVKDRCDAFLIALLPLAMRHKKDIICNSTVSEELLHNIRNMLIPSLTKNGAGFYKSRVSADFNKKVIKSAEAVGTGLAMGIDSLHVLHHYLDSEYPAISLTHVCVNDFAIENSDVDDKTVAANPLIQKALDLAQELEVACIHIKSNLLSDFEVDYNRDSIYCNLFPIFALQKLFKFYIYASSEWDYSCFSVKNADKRAASVYGLLLTRALSVSNLMIYNEGGEKNMLEKLEDIIHFSPAHRYLHSCTAGSDKNCNKCYKCIRTLLSLDALDKVEYFSQVYDTDYYQKNKRTFLTYLEKCHDKNDKILEPVYNCFAKKKQLTCSPPVVHTKGILLPDNLNTSAILLKNLTDGNIILSKQTKDFLPAVGLAKILTALLALESGKNQLVVDLPLDSFEDIQKASIYDLVNILLLTQNSIVSYIIAEAVSGSIQAFVDLMNETLRNIKVFNTQFVNQNGIGQGNYTTADDTLKIMEYALTNKHFSKIFKSLNYSFYVSENEKDIINQNPILNPRHSFYIPECVGARYGVQGIYANHIVLFCKDGKEYLLILLGIKDDKKELRRFSEVKNIITSVL